MKENQTMSISETSQKLLALMEKLNFSQRTINIVMGNDYYHDTILMVLEERPNTHQATVIRLAMDD